MKTLYTIAFWTAMLILWIIANIGCTEKARTHKIDDHRKHGRHYL